MTGTMLLDPIEAAYIAFRRAPPGHRSATSCNCNSCRLAPRRDLKVFVHYGWSGEPTSLTGLVDRAPCIALGRTDAKLDACTKRRT